MLEGPLFKCARFGRNTGNGVTTGHLFLLDRNFPHCAVDSRRKGKQRKAESDWRCSAGKRYRYATMNSDLGWVCFVSPSGTQGQVNSSGSSCTETRPACRPSRSDPFSYHLSYHRDLRWILFFHSLTTSRYRDWRWILLSPNGPGKLGVCYGAICLLICMGFPASIWPRRLQQSTKRQGEQCEHVSKGNAVIARDSICLKGPVRL